MKIIGIICEYNPFHNGHAKQLRQIRERYGADAAIVCLMCGNYVQRGEPAIFDKSVRARAAALCGADLVLELPITCALRSAEGFADGGVEILDTLGADVLCFGCECGDSNYIMSTAKTLLRPEFNGALREELERGVSFAAAREAAFSRFGDASALRNPNDILAVEYAKAVLRRGSQMELFAIPRAGDYHGTDEDNENPSASYLRQQMIEGGTWKNAVPEAVAMLYDAAQLHTMAAGERAVLARLRTLPEEAFAALPYGSEGLWSKFRKACLSEANAEGVVAATKSKRYARTRIQRMLMCAYLGITEDELAAQAPYVRVLAFDRTGRALLRAIRESPLRLQLINAGQQPDNADYYAMECRAADLYTLFCEGENAFPCGLEQKSRIFYQDLEKNTCIP